MTIEQPKSVADLIKERERISSPELAQELAESTKSLRDFGVQLEHDADDILSRKKGLIAGFRTEDISARIVRNRASEMHLLAENLEAESYALVKQIESGDSSPELERALRWQLLKTKMLSRMYRLLYSVVSPHSTDNLSERMLAWSAEMDVIEERERDPEWQKAQEAESAKEAIGGETADRIREEMRGRPEMGM